MFFFLATSFATAASAQFQLRYPPPRGPSVEDAESTFCGGYSNAVSTRTTFPIENGIINMQIEKPTWSAKVMISTSENPTSFADFGACSGYELVPHFRATGEGQFCFPIDLAASGAPGIEDGANVTIQVVFEGGDGPIYQCADLTLSADATLPCSAHHGCTDVTASAKDDGREQTVMPRQKRSEGYEIAHVEERKRRRKKHKPYRNHTSDATGNVVPTSGMLAVVAMGVGVVL